MNLPSIAAPAALSFAFNSHPVRVVMRDGAPWFVATDVAEALEYRDAAEASRYLDDDEKGTWIPRTPSGGQRLTIISESGLYALVLRSRKPGARRFAKWVTSEILPSIRKTGAYGAAAVRVDAAGRLADGSARMAAWAHMEQFVAGARTLADQHGVSLPGSSRPNDELVAGMVMDVCLAHRWLLQFDPKGAMTMRAIASEERSVNVRDKAALHAFVEALPMDALDAVLTHGIARLTKHA